MFLHSARVGGVTMVDGLGRVWRVVGAGHAAEDLEDHPKVTVGGEVGEFDTVELAAEGQGFSPLDLLRDRVVEVGRGEGDVVDTFALLGEEARKDSLVVERLDPTSATGRRVRDESAMLTAGARRESGRRRGWV